MLIHVSRYSDVDLLKRTIQIYLFLYQNIQKKLAKEEQNNYIFKSDTSIALN